MQSDLLCRRDFVASVGSLGAAWLIADATDRGDAARHAAHQLTLQQPSFAFFSREQAAEIEAIASRIIPSDDSPGAREAGVVPWIGR